MPFIPQLGNRHRYESAYQNLFEKIKSRLRLTLVVALPSARAASAIPRNPQRRHLPSIRRLHMFFETYNLQYVRLHNLYDPI